MKKLMICLMIILAIVVGLFFMITQKENQIDLYTDVVKVNEVDQNMSGDYFVYFSKESCSYCEDIRNDVEEFIGELAKNNPEVGFYLVDMDDAENSDYFTTVEEPVAGTDYYIDPAIIPEDFDINEFKIAGTPTLIYVSDGVITDIAIGATGEKTETTAMGVVELLEKKATDLGFKFDADFNN